MTAQNNSEIPVVSTGETNISGALLPQPPIPPQVPVEPPKAPMPIPSTAPSSENNVRANPPGWQFQQGKQIAPAAARAIIEARVHDESKIYKPAQKRGFASNTVQGPASIVELARALKNDPQLIYEFVYNNIEWEPGFSQQKGSLGCLLDGMGNSFDQTDLLVKLLRQAGFTANFVLGTIKLTEAELMAWFGTNDIWGSAAYCGNENIPYQSPVWNGTGWDMVLSHMWAEVVISGTTYVMDPSRKTYSRTAPVSSLATIIGYTPATFLSNATSGATVNTDYVQNMNKANIQSDLTTMTSNLVTYIKNNAIGSASAGTATVDDILGGQSIVPVTLPITFATSLSYQTPGDVPTIWTGNIPLAYQTTLQVQFPDNSGGWCIDETFTSDQLAGTRLTITYDGSLQPLLKLDGVTIATGIAQGAGTWNSVLLTVTHNGYPVNWYDQQWWQQFIWAGQHYLIGNAWGNLGDGQADLHGERLSASLAGGGTPTTEPVMGEKLSVIWFKWASQASRVTDLVGRIMNCHMMNNHQVGIISFNNGGANAYATDIGGVSWSSTNLNNDVTKTPINDTVVAMHGVALEAAALAQMNSLTPGISTTTVIDAANTAGDRIYKGTSSNWTVGSNVSATLVANGYSVGDMSDIGGYLGFGYIALLGDQPVRTLGAWSGWGDWLFPSAGGFGLINGGYKGGGAQPGEMTEEEIRKLIEEWEKMKKEKEQQEEGDPIGLPGGAFSYERSDISVGSQEAPYSITFARRYASSGRSSNTALGFGWTHNHNIGATVKSNGQLALGERFALQGAATIVQLLVATDLLADTSRPVEKLVTASLADVWWIDQIVNNVVGISFAIGEQVYVKQPDGSYTAPALFPSTLVLAAGLYSLTLPNGVKYNFNASRQINTIVYPDGVTLTYTYTSGLLTAVSNGLGRTLTLSYTGTLLTSVSDGNGRSVQYGFDANKNLTSFTNINSDGFVYEYDQLGRMTKYFAPANPLTPVVTNVYDSLSRVKTQANANNQLLTFYLAGSRSEVVDPVGNSKIAYYNRNMSTIREVDALGNVTSYSYDGFERLTATTFAEGNQVLGTYDAFNNLLTKTFVPKAGSGLANTVMTFTYDPVWRKVKTAQDGRLNTTTYSYDAVTGSLLTIQRPLIGGFTPTETYTYNGRGQLLTATDPTGLVVKYSYDVSTEKLISKVVDFGGVGHLNLTYSYTFDAVGNLSGLTNPNGNQTLFAYNNARQMTQRTEATPFAFVSNYQYDKNGLLTRFQKQVSSAPTWQTVNVSYTLTEQPYQMTDPLGRVTTFAYDGADRRQSVTDAEGRVYQYAYDQLNRLMTVTDPSSTISDTRTYSANGKLASVKDANNNTTLFAYDGFDRLGRVTFADTSYEERTSYDANSNVLTFRTRSGNTITNTYDVLNRLSTKAPTGQPTVTYTYDLANRRTKVNKPTVAGDPSTGDFQLFYDTAGRFVQEQYPDAKTVTHVLDSNGNKTKTTWPDGYFVTRVFDQLDRLTDIKLNGSGSSAAVFAYDQLSRRSSLTLSNGASSSYTYDLDSSLVSLNHAFVGSSVNFLMGYNNVAQQVSMGVSDPNYVWHPGAPGTVTYGTADSANKYPSVGGVSYSYDGNKNLTGDGTWTFAYDTESHLLSANKSGVSASYVYDPMHRQAQKTVGSAKTRFIYSGTRQIAEYDGVTGNLLNRYVFAGSDQAIIQISSGGTVSFFHQDRQGSVIATTNSSGVVTNNNSYSPFGQSAAALASNFGFTGQRFDQETGLYYFKARHYSPVIGRFLQPDLVGYGDGLNMFSYVGNDPMNKRDSTGMFSTVVDYLPFEQFNRIFDMIIGGMLGGGGERSKGKGEQPPPMPGDGGGSTGILTPGAEDLPLFNDSGDSGSGGGTAVEEPPTKPEPGTAGGGAGDGGGDDNGGKPLPPDGNDEGDDGFYGPQQPPIVLPPGYVPAGDEPPTRSSTPGTPGPERQVPLGPSSNPIPLQPSYDAHDWPNQRN